jgi:hypothetical protein
MVTRLRLFAALGAPVTVALVVWLSAPPASVGIPKVQLWPTAALMGPPTTMKSPIVATPTRARSTLVNSFRSALVGP